MGQMKYGLRAACSHSQPESRHTHRQSRIFAERTDGQSASGYRTPKNPHMLRRVLNFVHIFHV